MPRQASLKIRGSNIACRSARPDYHDTNDFPPTFNNETLTRFSEPGWPKNPTYLANSDVWHSAMRRASTIFAKSWSTQPETIGPAAPRLLGKRTTLFCSPRPILAPESSFYVSSIEHCLRRDLCTASMIRLFSRYVPNLSFPVGLVYARWCVWWPPLFPFCFVNEIFRWSMSPFAAILFCILLQEAIGIILAAWIGIRLCSRRIKSSSRSRSEQATSRFPAIAYPIGNENRHMLVTIFARRSMLIAGVIVLFGSGLQRLCLDPKRARAEWAAHLGRLRFFSELERKRQLRAFRTVGCGARPRKGRIPLPYPVRFMLCLHLYLDLFQAIFSGALAYSELAWVTSISFILSVGTVVRIVTVDMPLMFNHRFCCGGCCCPYWMLYRIIRLLCCNCCLCRRVTSQAQFRLSRHRRRRDLERRNSMIEIMEVRNPLAACEAGAVPDQPEANETESSRELAGRTRRN